MTFELDRFAWTPGALEVSGRWRSDVPRRFRHVRLVVQENGRPRRLAPRRSTPMRATPEGEPWAATFAWESDKAPEQPLLEAGHDLLVELPAPDRVEVIAGHPATPAVARLEAEIASLRAELAAERELTGALRRKLAAERAKAAEAESATRDEAAAVQREAWAAAQQLAGEREALAAERAAFEAERDALAAASPQPATAERAGPVSAERAPLWAGNGDAPARPRHAAIQQALHRPRQPDDHVRGRAPLPVRIIAMTLSAGVLVGLGMILGAIL